MWDAATARAAAAGDLRLAHDLLAQLREELPATRAALARHAADGDWFGVAAVAHRCAGGAAYCGVPALSAALRDLEGSVHAGGGDHRPALAVVVREIDRLLAFVPDA